jgi:hypothetical protein
MCSIPLEDVDLINRQQAEIERLQRYARALERVDELEKEMVGDDNG